MDIKQGFGSNVRLSKPRFALWYTGVSVAAWEYSNNKPSPATQPSWIPATRLNMGMTYQFLTSAKAPQTKPFNFRIQQTAINQPKRFFMAWMSGLHGGDSVS